VPGLATHLCEGLISPGHDWLAEMTRPDLDAAGSPDTTFKPADNPGEI
jgi:hypothetical protein